MKNRTKKRRRILFWIIVVIICTFGGYKSASLYYKIKDSKEEKVQALASNKAEKSEQKNKNISDTSKNEQKDGNYIDIEKPEANNEQNSNDVNKAQNTVNKDKNTNQVANININASTKSAAKAQAVIPKGGKVVYLTFDDGPSPQVTPRVLDILKANNIKATFFTIGKMDQYNPKILLREKNEGHVIGNHSYSHDYGSVYKNAASFHEEIEHTTKIINSILGSSYKVHLVRMPGGSFGKSKVFMDEVGVMGYNYVDWNCLSRDAEGKKLSAQEEFNNIVQTSKGINQVIILMHDAGAQTNTPAALTMTINYFKSQGYEFKTLN